MRKLKRTKKFFGPVATKISRENTGSWRTRRPQTEQESCVRCGTCSEYCPPGVILIHKKGAIAFEVDLENCKGCGICASLCPQNCIKMIMEGEADD